MKKIFAFLMVLALTVSTWNYSPVKAETKEFNMTVGTEYKGTLTGESLWGIMINDEAVYTFSVSKATTVKVNVKYSGSKCSYTLKNSSGSYVYTDNNNSAYINAGTYKLVVSGYGVTYSAQVINVGSGAVKFGKSSKTLKDATEIPFTYTCTADQAQKSISVSSSKPKVAKATVSVNRDGTGSVRVTPGDAIAKTTITLRLAGGNTTKFTIMVKSTLRCVAKGSKAKMPKPIGFKKLKWKSSKKKVATVNKKTGKIKAKKGGRTPITAKKGKNKFTIKLVVTDYIKLAKKTYREIKDTVNNPDKLKIYNVYKGYNKQVYTSGIKVPVVMIDFGSTNSFGAMIRSKIMAYYDDVHEAKFVAVSNANNIISKKSIKKSKIK